MAMRYYAPFPGEGDPAQPPGPHALRIGDAERDAAAADLGEHYAAGRLAIDELHDRLDAVFAAKTAGQLTRIMADLPGSGPLPWRTGPKRLPGPGHRLGPGLYGAAWGPAGWRYDGQFKPAEEELGPVDESWHAAGRRWQADGAPVTGFSPGELDDSQTPSDRAGRFAALSLLLLAMLIWLFTALLFARHGVYHPGGPYGPGSVHYYPGSSYSGPSYFSQGPG
jgi:Domain of unknown function (DUF1707)